MTVRLRRSKIVFFAAAILLLAAFATANTWKPIAKRQSKWVVVATNLYQNLLRRTHLRTDQIGQVEARGADDAERALEAIDHTFDGYLRHSGLTAADLAGKRVLELGPGDNIGVALRFAAAGATFVSTIDKFVPFQDSEYHRRL